MIIKNVVYYHLITQQSTKYFLFKLPNVLRTKLKRFKPNLLYVS